MKQLFILSFAILAIGCSGVDNHSDKNNNTNNLNNNNIDKAVAIDKIRTIDGKFYDFSNVSGFTGTILEYDDVQKDKIVATAQVKNGVLSGIVEGFRLDGTKLYQQRYLNGKLDGKTTGYNTKEIPTYEREYLNGRAHGKYNLFYDDGTLKYSQIYTNNQLNGKSIAYNPDGSLESEETFKNGVSIERIDYNKPNKKVFFTFDIRDNQSVVDKEVELDE